MIRHAWIGAHADVTQKRQCVLAGVSRTTVYVKRKPVVFVESDEVLKRLIDEEYTRHPFYGSRKMVVYLGRCGHLVNRKRVQRLMRCMSLAAWTAGAGRMTTSLWSGFGGASSMKTSTSTATPPWAS